MSYDYPSSKLTRSQKAIFGFQHMVAMFGATILVAILVNGYFGGEIDIGQITLLCAGLGTLLFHAVTRGKVPAFLGSSFAFLGGFSTIAELNTGKYANMSYAEKFPYACGGIVVAGLLYLVLAGLIKLVGVKKVMRFFPPVVTGPIIICIGLSLLPSAIANCRVNWVLAILVLVLVIYFNVWGKGMSKIIAILLAVTLSYVVAAIGHSFGWVNPDGSAVINTAAISGASLIGLPKFTFAKFDLPSILVMAPIAIATMMEHVGDISAISATVGSNFIEDPGLHRTLLGDGLATALAGLIGGPANTTYGENTGVLALSKVYDPVVIRIAALYAVILGFIPKLAGVFTAMPTAIIGGISLMLYGMISAIGVRNMVENRVNLLNSRNLIVVAMIMAAGLGGLTITFTIGGTPITITSLALAAIVGVIMNAILPGKDYEFGVRPEGDIHRGVSFNDPPQSPNSQKGRHIYGGMM
ncbi:uracil-xanthine permease [Candidatus Saccharibacteria bacterium]|nr:uracil-xanthine permease [Candidatus Saccharibacteria bacterium]